MQYCAGEAEGRRSGQGWEGRRGGRTWMARLGTERRVSRQGSGCGLFWRLNPQYMKITPSA